MAKMTQAIMTEPGNIIYQEVDIPEVKPDQIKVKMKRIGICGSDIHVNHGKHPYTSYPVVQGHEVSAEVVETGKDVTTWQGGRQSDHTATGCMRQVLSLHARNVQ